MERLPELQEAVRAIEGVAAARVTWPDPAAPAKLAVTFAEDADRDAVAAAVLAAVEDVGGVRRDEVDVWRATAPVRTSRVGDRAEAATSTEAVGPDPRDPAPATSSGREETGPGAHPVRGPRPAFRSLVVAREALDTSVTVTLTFGGRSASASVQGLALTRHPPRTAGVAALKALREFLPDDVRVELEWLDVAPSWTPGRPDLVHASVLYLTPEGEHAFLGTAVVRGDLAEAAVRATLDALNRRLERMSLPMAS